LNGVGGDGRDVFGGANKAHNFVGSLTRGLARSLFRPGHREGGPRVDALQTPREGTWLKAHVILFDFSTHATPVVSQLGVLSVPSQVRIPSQMLEPNVFLSLTALCLLCNSSLVSFLLRLTILQNVLSALAHNVFPIALAGRHCGFGRLAMFEPWW
jgi:hypothetical protein